MSDADNKGDDDRPHEDERWARDLIGRVAFAALLERRRSRRWGIFFKFLIFAYLTFFVLINLPVSWEGKAIMGARHTALVTVDGLIASSAEASAENVIAGVRAAFDDERTAGIVLEINSPGGSPVQAGEIFDEVSRLRDLHPDIPVYAVAIDVCASGGYYVAAAAKQIFANRASIIGSIGVRADSFGFVGAMEKLGIERRLYVAGNDKAFLDPFSPPRPAEVAHLQGMLDDIHRQFIAAVKKGRGDRLSNSPELFSGLVWTGDQSLELGLIDGLGSTQYVAEQVIGVKDIADFTRRPKVFDRIFDGIQSALLGAGGSGLRFH